jgi:WD40 repeat protein
LNNYEGHIDWVNDLAISKTNKLLFSCSNDKNINIWKIPNLFDENISQTTPLITPSYSIFQYHRDYIKSLCHKEGMSSIYACGYDGLITSHNIEEYRKNNVIILNNDNFIYKSNNNNSIYSFDCDQTGNVILSSVYENVI